MSTEIASEDVRPARSAVEASVAAAKRHGGRFIEAIIWQIENRAWEVLGYNSWREMREAEYADIAAVIPRGERPEIVAQLRDAGLSNREAAKTLGITEGTVRNDVRKTTQPPVEAPKQRRRPLPDAFLKYHRELAKRAASMHKLIADDRWDRNAATVADRGTLKELQTAREQLDQVITALESAKAE